MTAKNDYVAAERGEWREPFAEPEWKRVKEGAEMCQGIGLLAFVLGPGAAGLIWWIEVSGWVWLVALGVCWGTGCLLSMVGQIMHLRSALERIHAGLS